MSHLPLIKTETKSAEPLKQVAQLKGGTETILFAEDDVTLKRLSKKVLEEFGYTVIEAIDGQDAIDKFRTYGNRIDLLLTDIIMPKKNGREVYEEVLKIAPGIKALFISGYPPDVIQEKGMLSKDVSFLGKPFSPHELLRTIRAVLDR